MPSRYLAVARHRPLGSPQASPHFAAQVSCHQIDQANHPWDQSLGGAIPGFFERGFAVLERLDQLLFA